MREELALEGLTDGGAHEEVRISLAGGPPYVLWAERPGGEAQRFEGGDLSLCPAKLRRSLEAEGVLLLCQGARPDVLPSGLLRQMSGGREMYVVDPETGRTTRETVDIFLPARGDQVVSYQEQRAAFFAFTGLTDRGWQMPD